MRGIPIFTFINKLDREGKEPFALLEEIEQVLDIETHPMNWPVGMGKQFLGIFDRQEEQFVQFHNNEDETQIPYADLDLPEHKEMVSDANYQAASEELELLDGAGDSFSLDAVLAGKQTPVFFGSALAPFGVESFFNTFISLAPSPAPRKSTEGVISPDKLDLSVFIFKIQ